MKRFAPVIFYLLLVARRSYSLMRLVRALYHVPLLHQQRRFFDIFFDPNSIRRHTNFNIPSQYVHVKGKLGEQLRVNLGDHIGWHIFLNGYFDMVPSLVAMVLSRAEPTGVYLDVGANIGDTSIAVANRGVNTVGIDASAMAMSELCHNIALNSPIPYTVVHAAVAASSPVRNGDIENDYVRLHVPMGNTGAASVHARWNTDKKSNSSLLASRRSVTDIVDALSIKSLCCIKLDVEGAEHDALQGMKSILQRFQCPVVFEYRIDHCDDVGLESSSIIDLLPVGYVCFSITCEQIQDESAVLRVAEFNRDCSYENVLGVYGAVPAVLEAARRPEGLVVFFYDIGNDGRKEVVRSRCA